MFSKSRNDRCRLIGDRAAADRPGIATTPQGSAITSQKSAITRQKSAITPQKSAMAPQGSSISPRTWSHAKLCPEWRLEHLCSWKKNFRGVPGRGRWWTCALCSDAKWKFIFFGGGYINQLLLFICILVFSGINNFTLGNKSDMTCPMGL